MIIILYIVLYIMIYMVCVGTASSSAFCCSIIIIMMIPLVVRHIHTLFHYFMFIRPPGKFIMLLYMSCNSCPLFICATARLRARRYNKDERQSYFCSSIYSCASLFLLIMIIICLILLLYCLKP